jgi:hypothetical protein
MPSAPARLSRVQVLRYRARASHLEARLARGSLAEAAWGGLQDTAPRSGLLSLHARVAGVEPASWEDPSLAQIWFRGADYIVPRADLGVFTLGASPRDTARAAALEALADAVHELTKGRITPTRDLPAGLGDRPFRVRETSKTGRVLTRWDAANIWVIPSERPAIDPEEARRELARRFLHWHGPATPQRLARWAGLEPRDAAETWRAIEGEIAPVEIAAVDTELGGERRFMLAADLERARTSLPIEGARLIPVDDPFTKYDHELLVADDGLRAMALPKVGRSPGYIPGAVVVDGEVVGGWQRQQRRVTIHPFPGARLDRGQREAIEREALAFPIAGSAPAAVSWA